MPDVLTVCEEACRAAGEELLSWRGRFKVREKGPADLVTEADFAAQEVVRGILATAFPDHDFLSEEDPHSRLSDGRPRWILDPLDGTQNFVHDLPLFAVSLGLEQDGRVIAGCIHNPILDRCYTAEQGRGTRLNGQPIRVTEVATIEQALVAVSLPPRVRRDSTELRNAVEIAAESQGIRRFGSSAMNMAFVAEGALDAFFANETCVWDIAAGIILVEEAGGCVTGFDGQPVDLRRPQLIASATRELNAQMRQRLRNA